MIRTTRTALTLLLTITSALLGCAQTTERQAIQPSDTASQQTSTDNAPATQPKEAAPRELAVVRTWTELRNQPAIEVEGVGPVRIGIEAREVPAWSGVLMYALVEHHERVDLEDRNPSYALGPLQVRVWRKGQARDQRDTSASMHKAEGTGPALYAKGIGLPAAGAFDTPEDATYIVDVRRTDGTPVARTTITTSDKTAHPWTPLEPGTLGKRLQRKHAVPGDPDMSATLAAPSEHIILPDYGGHVPLVAHSSRTLVSRKVQEPLPRMVPRQAEARLRLSWRRNGLWIESDDEMIIARPDWHFLARWWVNGEPWTPEQPNAFRGDANGLITSGHTTYIELAFDRQRIGAEPGDRVSVQLMHSPAGWSYVLPPGQHLQRLRTLHHGPPRLTNRLELIVAEDGSLKPARRPEKRQLRWSPPNARGLPSPGFKRASTSIPPSPLHAAHRLGARRDE